MKSNLTVTELPLRSVTNMYNKLFTKILDSSIWMESADTRLVWLTFIAAMDETGFVQFASPANVAHRARVDLKGAEEALASLEAPDPNSFDPDNEGRRIERVPGGWIVLNAAKYREIVTRSISKEQTRERVARFREKRKGNADVTQSGSGTDSAAPAKADSHPKPMSVAPLLVLEGGEKKAKAWNPTKEQLRVGGWFGRKASTVWSDTELKAWRKLQIEDEDLSLLDEFYTAPKAEDATKYRRKDLGALLNNWNGELDKAREWQLSPALPVYKDEWQPASGI